MQDNMVITRFISCFGFLVFCVGGFAFSVQAAPSDRLTELKAYMDKIKAAHFDKDWVKKAELTRQSLPTTEDWQQVITAEGWKHFQHKVFTKELGKYTKNPKRLARLYRIRKHQTEYRIDQATTEQLQDSKHPLPGGMGRVARHLRPGIVWVRLKLTEPNKTYGVSYTAFAYVNGRWVIFPKPWRYFRQAEPPTR